MFYIMHMHILWCHAKEDPSKGDQKNEPIQRGPIQRESNPKETQKRGSKEDEDWSKGDQIKKGLD